jgi:hypothetical protein
VRYFLRTGAEIDTQASTPRNIRMQEQGPDMNDPRHCKHDALPCAALAFALRENQGASSVPLLLAMRVRSLLTVTYQFNT